MTQNDRLTLQHIVEHVDAKAQSFCALSDRIWHMPELAFEEQRSCEEHVAALAAEGFHIARKAGGIETAFMAEYGEGGPVLAFLGEYDALPDLSQASGVEKAEPLQRGGPGHGCGHNLLGAGAALAAVALKDALAAAGIEGRVRYYGCPAEESGSGKSFMARAGVFDDVDVAFCWHPSVVNEVVAASSLAFIQCYFRFAGRASHAAASPHLGRSALDAVELMNIAVNYMREHMPAEARIHYAVTNSGGIAPNVVQANAEVLYLVRSPDIAETKRLFERVRKAAEGAALMTETQASFQVTDAGLNLVPNETLLEAMHDNMVRIGAPAFDGDDRDFAERLRRASLSDEDIAASVASHDPTLAAHILHEGILPLARHASVQMGSTDVGDVSWIAPTVQCHTACFAIGTPFHSWQLVTQGLEPAAHKGMVAAAKALASTAADCLSKPDLIARAKAELKRRTGGRPFESPIPPEILPEHLHSSQGR
ncbi:amidohydrolase [Labrys sp. KNU-23]|uniref:amidohydrolase n=1 Tax=Labrys sp. KNU-23 TaxID=2789216 RepID=UPI0011EF7DEB|nr:amidohydrolase [Labrys sp. KNU-23]QEN89004.1 amidohydrolase [Labrys sp. KNU-23]